MNYCFRNNRRSRSRRKAGRVGAKQRSALANGIRPIKNYGGKIPFGFAQIATLGNVYASIPLPSLKRYFAPLAPAKAGGRDGIAKQ